MWQNTMMLCSVMYTILLLPFWSACKDWYAIIFAHAFSAYLFYDAAII